MRICFMFIYYGRLLSLSVLFISTWLFDVIEKINNDDDDETILMDSLK